MPRIKRTIKKSKGSSSVVPPPNDHPLARYFASNEDLQFYEARLAGRKEIPPRYLDPTLLVIHKFDTLKAILVHQGLMDFVQIKSKYYPDLVAIAYSTLMLEINEEDESNFTLFFKIGRKDYRLDGDELATIWELPNQGDLFQGGKTPIDEWGYSKDNAMHLFNLVQGAHSKISCNSMSAEHRTLLYLVTYVLQPRISGHANVNDEDLIVMWAMMNGIKINWPYFIVQHMIRLKMKDRNGGLGFLCLWSKVFDYVGIDVSNEIAKEVPPQSCINTHLLNKMGRRNVDEQGPQEQAPPQAPQAQEPPSLVDVMRELQSINQNIQRIEVEHGRQLEALNRRVSRVDHRTGRLDRRIDDLYEHFGIHLPYEEDTDDDEDQD